MVLYNIFGNDIILNNVLYISSIKDINLVKNPLLHNTKIQYFFGIHLPAKTIYVREDNKEKLKGIREELLKVIESI